jgi:hypothetical protein
MRELHSHCQCDQCNGEDCEGLPKVKSIQEYTTEEIVDILCKRDNVDHSICPSNEKWWVEFAEDTNHYDVMKGMGQVTILVVKKNE